MILSVMLAFAISGCEGQSSGRDALSVSGDADPGSIAIAPISSASGSSGGVAAENGLTEAASLDSQLALIISAYDAYNHYTMVERLAADSLEGRLAGSAGAQAAAAMIEREFKRSGLLPWTGLGLTSYRQSFSLDGITDDNIIGLIPGTDPAAGYAILAGHYDHLGISIYGQVYNGADDNAAGAAAVIEAARLFAKTGLRPARTMVFCAFSGEEAGQLGSRALGALISQHGLSSAVEMVNIDGIGAIGGSYLGVWDEGYAQAAPVVSALITAGGHTGVRVVEEGTDIGSDAQPFDWIYGIPAVTVDWDWGSDPSLYHPYYHSVDDDPQYIDRKVMALATRTILVGFWLRAQTAAEGNPT